MNSSVCEWMKIRHILKLNKRMAICKTKMRHWMTKAIQLSGKERKLKIRRKRGKWGRMQRGIFIIASHHHCKAWLCAACRTSHRSTVIRQRSVSAGVLCPLDKKQTRNRICLFNNGSWLFIINWKKQTLIAWMLLQNKKLIDTII